jgi:hypothetical protein
VEALVASGLGMRQRLLIAAIAAATLLAPQPLGEPAPVNAGSATSMLFLDTAWGYTNDAGKIRSIVSPDEGVLQANSSQFESPAGVGAIFAVTPTDTTEDGASWTLEFEAPPGQTLVPGTYAGGSEFYERGAGEAFFRITPGACGLLGISTFTVHEADFDEDGVPTAFAATFTERCGVGYEPRTGEIRFNSSVGVRAREITPIDGIDFPLTDEGDESASESVTVTNTGTLTLHPGAAIPDSELVVRDDCPTTLAPGANCTIEFASRPTLPGHLSAWLTVVDDSVAGTHQVHTTVKGRVHTTTTLTSSLDPDIYPGDESTLTATITPAPPTGTDVKFFQDGNLYTTKTVIQGEAESGYIGFSGTHTLTAAFQGHTYYMPSTSNALNQSSFERPVLKLFVSHVGGPPEQPLLVESSIARAVGSPSEKGGTVTLTDELTGETLGTYGMADATPSMELCPDRLSVGTHRIRATYSGFGDILGTTMYIDVAVSEGALIVAGTLAPGESGVRCAHFRTFDEAFAPAPGQNLIVNQAVITTLLPGVATRPITQVRISNSGDVTPNGVLADSLVLPYGSPFEWSLINPTYGGVDEDGFHEVWWQLKTDDGLWTVPFLRFVGLDRNAPSGTVSVAAGATYASGTSVTVAVPGTDSGTGVSQVALSNNGTTWTTRAYAATQAWTLSSANGTKTVHVKWQDIAGNWSDVSSDAIVLDSIAPTASAPRSAFLNGSTVNGGVLPATFTWTGVDATSGVARYEASLRTDGGAWSTISTNLLTPTVTQNLAAGHTYRLRVRATDNAGNVGAWSLGSAFSVNAYQEGSSRFTWTGDWTRPSNTGYWAGRERASTDAGAKVTFTFTGRSLAWIGSVGAARGSAKIYVDGALVKTVDLSAGATAYRTVLASLTWSTAMSRKVKIVVVGTAGHPRVNVDAFVTG